MPLPSDNSGQSRIVARVVRFAVGVHDTPLLVQPFLLRFGSARDTVRRVFRNTTALGDGIINRSNVSICQPI
jgi:hypothetical protein